MGQETYRASGVEEAVETAARFHRDGRYNWFRGQVHDWPPHSSMFRALSSEDPERVQKALRRVEMFLRWMKETPELKHLLDDPNAAVAVAQHHGIPTNYIDFTTEPGVAGFFAADAPEIPKDEKSACIFCLNTDDLLRIWELMRPFRPKAHLELVTIDVSNLWRLEAQHGCFLYCDYNWDVDYPMDRILFPYSGYPSWPTREDIYPPQKSPLELLLDQYFDVEQKTFGTLWLRQQFEELIAKGAKNIFWYNDKAPVAGYREGAIHVAKLPKLTSWKSAALKGWTGIAIERMDQTIGAPIVLQVKPATSSLESANSVSYGVRQLLTTRPHSRQTIFEWQLRGLPKQDNLDVDKLSQAFQAVWNGMRSLPYTDEEIADAFGVTTQLFLEGFSADGDLLSAQKVMGDCFQAEFGVADGSSSRGYVTRKSLRAGLRSDLLDFASEQLIKNMQADVRWVLQAIFAPKLLIEFDHMRTIFARELIPTQVFTRKLVLYSPARLETFGLP
jgi:hypothetical protein